MIIAGSFYTSYSEFSDNNADIAGGIYIETAALEVEYSDVSYNTAIYGGGLFINSVTNGTFKNTNFTYNMASTDGGALYIYQNSSVIFDMCKFVSNEASNFGGVMYASESSDIDIKNSSFLTNTAGFGVCFGIDSHCSFYAEDSEFIGGTSMSGSIGCVFGPTVQEVVLKDCVLEDNVSDNGTLVAEEYADNSLISINE